MIRLTLTHGSLEALKTNNEGGIPLEEFPLGFNTGGMFAFFLLHSSIFIFDAIQTSSLTLRW